MAEPEPAVDFDPATLEVMWSRLIAVADESAAALLRTSFSTIVRESNDYACALMLLDGSLLAESSIAVPSFIGTMPRTLRHCLKRFPPETLRPGDAIITNDPWMATGHSNDITLVAPVFHRDRLVAFAGNIAHSSDIGGSMWAADARDTFEEGLRLVPAKLVEGGALNEGLVEVICANVRVPEQVMGDLHAQVAAAEVCSRRLIDLLTESAIGDLDVLGRTIQDRAGAAMRKAIEAIPDGTYPHTVEMDGFDSPLTIRIEITVRGSNLHVDFAGTSPQIDRGINSVYSYSYAYTTYPLKCALDPATPKNEGTFRPITVEIPEGSVLNARFPAPVSARHLTGHYLAAAVLGALAAALPERVIADSACPTISVVFAGVGHGGRRFSQPWFPMGGMGARPDRDGLPCTPFPTNAGAGSYEVIESIVPLRFLKREMIADSGGAGRYRGGLGQEVLVELVSEEDAKVSVLADRLQHPPLGLLGGGPGSPAELRLNEADDFPAKGRTVMKPGDVLRLRCAGGGGYGSPRERSRELVLRDLKNGLITPEAARASYGLEG